jgi:hypothetical protein
MGWLRHPRTTQERREWSPEFGRAKRSRKRLVEAWDDIVTSEQRSWKEHRRTQWRPVNHLHDEGG